MPNDRGAGVTDSLILFLVDYSQNPLKTAWFCNQANSRSQSENDLISETGQERPFTGPL